jgi:hypothetical protein
MTCESSIYSLAAKLKICIHNNFLHLGKSDETIRIYIEVVIETITTSMIPDLYRQIHQGV